MPSTSPFTSQGYPFSKDLRSYDAEGLGRAFFADGLVAELGNLHLYDTGGWLAGSFTPGPARGAVVVPRAYNSSPITQWPEAK